MTPMTTSQIVITIAVVVLATVLDRFLPYIVFPEGRKIPEFVLYLGKVLAPAVFGLLVVYCLRNVSLTSGSRGIPELIAILVTVLIYRWRRGFILPMAAGTIVYMVLVQTIFAG
ncbi:MAG: branched-chain amino acid transporter permease [Lachnospiraceae bacterium]|jgi:branched-subunit amino acid transport protein AzlD